MIWGGRWDQTQASCRQCLSIPNHNNNYYWSCPSVLIGIINDLFPTSLTYIALSFSYGLSNVRKHFKSWRRLSWGSQSLLWQTTTWKLCIPQSIWIGSSAARWTCDGQENPISRKLQSWYLIIEKECFVVVWPEDILHTINLRYKLTINRLSWWCQVESLGSGCPAVTALSPTDRGKRMECLELWLLGYWKMLTPFQHS